MNYRNSCNYDNLERRIFEGVGEYGIPEIQPTSYGAAVTGLGSTMPNPAESLRGKVFISSWTITSSTAYGQI